MLCRGGLVTQPGQPNMMTDPITDYWMQHVHFKSSGLETSVFSDASSSTRKTFGCWQKEEQTLFVDAISYT